MSAPQTGPEVEFVAPELGFAAEVQQAYENLVPVGTSFDWVTRTQRFVEEGSNRLWQRWQQASTTEQVVYAGLAVGAAYIGFQILRGSVNAVFNLGEWLIDRVETIRRDSLELILQITLGATALALVPILYEGISRGSLTLESITRAWDDDGLSGVVSLLVSQFPEGLSSMSDDVQALVRRALGEDRFNQLFGEGAGALVTNDPAEVLEPPSVPPSNESPAISPEDLPIVDGILGITLSPETQLELQRVLSGDPEGAWGRVARSLMEQEGGFVVSNGALFLLNEAHELIDITNWFSLQYVESWQDAFASAQEFEDLWRGGLVLGYLAEVPKHVVMANSIDYLTHLFRRTPYSMLRSTFSGVMWGATVPLRIYGTARTILGVVPTGIRVVRDGFVLLNGAANIAKFTSTGAMLIWEGGRFVSREALRQATRVGLGRALGQAVSTTYVRSLGRQIANFTSRSFGQRLLTVAGWRGAVTATLWADDASVIGVLDDIVAVGMTAWLAVDVYDLVQITRRAHTFRRLMDEQQTLEVTNVEGVDETTIARLAEVEDAAEDWNEEDALALLSSMPRSEFTLTRANGRRETYLMVRGRILSVQILEGDEVLASFSEEDVETLSQELPPPQTFEAWEIDYLADAETLMAHYRLAFTYVMNETGWAALDYEIHNATTIEVKRRTSQQVMFIHREGEDWYLGADRETAFNLFQAISMANLINRVEDMLREQTRTPSGDTPFYAEDGGIYVDRPLNDTLILSDDEEGWYQRFYQGQLGLNPSTITDTLNFHYRAGLTHRDSLHEDDYMPDYIMP